MFIDNIYYTNKVFTDVVIYSSQVEVSSWEACQNLCESNQSCAAMSYDNNTSTCFQSDVPKVVNYTEQTGRLCLVKTMHFGCVEVYDVSTTLARGL